MFLHQAATEREFKSKVDDALKVVKTILENTRNPSLASHNHVHTYDDKFTLSEFITNIALAALLNVLNKLGLGEKKEVNDDNEEQNGGEHLPSSTATDFLESAKMLRKLAGVVQEDKKNITMRFMAKETCKFLRKEEIKLQEEIEVDAPQHVVVATKKETTSTESTNGGTDGKDSNYGDGKKTTTTTTTTTTSEFVSKVVQNVAKYYWKVEIEYCIYIFCGAETDINATNSVPIIKKTVSTEIMTKTSDSPYGATVDAKPLDVNLTWLLQNVNKETLETSFKVDREKASCRTPKHNREIRGANKLFSSLGAWFRRVGDYFEKKDDKVHSNDQSIMTRDKMDLSSIHSNNIFVPVLPIFESRFLGESDALVTSTNESDTSTTPSLSSPILPANDVNLFLQKQYLSMTNSVNDIMSQFSNEPFMSSIEATIVLLSKHACAINEIWSQGVNHIEDMLRTQLYNAIGKTVNSKDLDDFVRSYNQKIFADTYAPEPFCFAIRRPGHYPDGTVSIEEVESEIFLDEQKGAKHPLTFTRQLETSNGEHPMNIPINSSTSVQFNGNLFLHAWILQRFQTKPDFQIVSRARQFSSFLLLIGKLSGPDTFEPEHGIILQNQDEVLIPLIMDEMPSAKEFKDAIGSMSPEQQRFAKAFRDMKLSSSVFGICVVQLKPQLEMLLGLPEKSLTKEIRLTQDLLSLFIDYQIPSDLLSFDGEDGMEASAKVEVVKGHVKNVQSMISDLKNRDMEEARMKADMAKHEKLREKPFGFGSDVRAGAYYAVGSAEPNPPAGFFGAPAPAPPVTFGSMAAVSSPFGSAAPAPSMSFSSAEAKLSKMMMKKSSKEKSPVNYSMSSPKQQSNPTHTSTSTRNIIEQSSDGGKCTDLTMIPNQLDSKFEMFGPDERNEGTLRSTIIETGENWTKKFKQNLLSKVKKIILTDDKKKEEHNKAFDLLDALSKSGVLPMSHSEMHIVIASTHCFDKSVVNTVVQDNVNPIEKIERSNLLVASVIHDVGVTQLLSEAGEVGRVLSHSPMLIE